MKISLFRKILFVVAAFAAGLVWIPALKGILASEPGSGDWPMWGGTPDRNMVSDAKGIVSTWDVNTKKNVKWVSEVGSQNYGNPTVADGKVFVGTNNEGNRDKKIAGDKGVLMAFNESDGKFLWQQVNDKLSQGRANDWPYQGVASSPIVEGKRLYYTTNRSVIMCLNTEGFKDGVNNTKDPSRISITDADVIWKFDMIEEVGNYPHNLSNSSPLIWHNLLIVSTGNGQDETHNHIPSPRAPSVIALDKMTGKEVYEINDVGERILHGQWSTPTVGKIGDVEQLVSGQGDGWVRGYDVKDGKKLWSFDMNPKDSTWNKTRNEIISTPVIVDGVVYIANGQDPEHGEGVGHMYAIDGTKRGDITETGRIWHFDKIRRSISTAAVHNGLVYEADFSGFLHCLDAKTGKELWNYDMLSAVWASPFVVDGKVYLGDEDGDVRIFAEGKEMKKLAEMNMGSSVYSSAVVAHGVLFLTNRNQLFALTDKK
jgi:outer membrane protein assembly factor BamB